MKKVIFILMALFVLAGCADSTYEDSYKVIASFYDFQASQNMDGVALVTHQLLYTQTTREEFAGIVLGVEETLGPLREYTLESQYATEYNGLKAVEIIMKGDRELYESYETFVLIESGDSFKIAGYTVVSPGLSP